jgi:predicted extracellular nuclease
MKSILIYRILFGVVLCFSLYALAYAKPLEDGKRRTAVIGFYNVENLFDTIDDPLKKDNEFTPDSSKNWNSDRYDQKIEMLSEVIASMGSASNPAIIGLCEVENIDVLNDLSANAQIKKAKYEPILIEGPDQRGIDVALLYSKKLFKPISTNSYRVNLGDGERPTRDILHVRGALKGGGPIIHIFVNHWPSRYGGAEKSEPKRIAAAKVLAAKTDSIHQLYPNEAIICMGDFNDYPENRSLTEFLPTGETDLLANLMSGLKEAKRGSYNYRGDWDFLDQIIVSRSLIDGNLPDIVSGSTAPFFTDSMVYTHPKYGDVKPKRTYGGPEYLGGYSDHLPVYTILAY